MPPLSGRGQMVSVAARQKCASSPQVGAHAHAHPQLIVAELLSQPLQHICAALRQLPVSPGGSWGSRQVCGAVPGAPRALARLRQRQQTRVAFGGRRRGSAGSGGVPAPARISPLNTILRAVPRSLRRQRRGVTCCMSKGPTLGSNLGAPLAPGSFGQTPVCSVDSRGAWCVQR
jgi:hypothetical protein